MKTDSSISTGGPETTNVGAIVVCWAAIFSEGYDVGVMGAILPALASSHAWAVDSIQLGQLSSSALVGMLIGSFTVGTLSDVIGRKRMLLACIALFSLMTIGAATAGSPLIFSLFRLISGIGLGGVIPVAAALTIEYSSPSRRNINYALMYSGYSLGISASALVAHAFLAEHGWRIVVGIGGLPLFLLPVIAFAVPSTDQYRAAVPVSSAQEHQGAMRATKTILSTVFARSRLRTTVCFWIALFCGMVLIYGLTTWLPEMMRRTGMSLGPSLLFLMFFSAASAIGGIVLGQAADQLGARRVVGGAYLLGAVGIVGLISVDGIVLRYLMVMLAGIGTLSASLVLTGALASYYPSSVRGSATGWALGFSRFGAISGPIVAGYIAAAHLPLQDSIFFFAAAAILSSLAVWALPGSKVHHVSNEIIQVSRTD